MAGNLAERQTLNELPTIAYEQAYVGHIAGFDTCKSDVAIALPASTVVGGTVAGANQRHVPRATDTTQDGQQNFDNRTQFMNVAVAAGEFREGDAFTIDGLNSVHLIEKGDTFEPLTFRVISAMPVAGGNQVIEISPAIVAIDHAGVTTAEEQYQNSTATPADGAVITMLNTTDAQINPFWQYNAIELLPGRLILPQDAGLRVMSATTDQGVHVLMTAQGDINTLGVKYRLDTFFGTVLTAEQQAGIMIFNQQ